MKQKTLFLCSDCGYESPKWFGKCPSCGAWNTMSEFKVQPETATRGVLPSDGRGRIQNKPVLLDDIDTTSEDRFHSGIGELDRVLGGGAVHGSFVLVGGEPGIGKSTLLLQMCQEMCKAAKVLYVSGEESLRQIKLRARRLDVRSSNLFVLAETDMDEIVQETDLLKPDILIVDSIQTVYRRDLTAAPGGTTQIKECAMSLMQYAKRNSVTIFIVGHVNKEGTLAGPKILEHMVDCVLYFEGERTGPFRCLRAAKNRFGSTNEIGVFEMSDRGLLEVQNPSAAMLAGHPTGASGNCIACVMEGTRPLLAEVQALVAKTQFGGSPRRTAAGVDYNRMVLLLAILEKRAGLFLSGSDAYVNVVGGMRLDEPAADLPMLLAIASSFRDKPLPEGVMSFGEVGLTGELRAVSSAAQRIQEAYRLGFHTCIMPMQDLGDGLPKDMNVVQVRTVQDAIRAVL
ncbi:MAG: DNA repair protein RadA [Butyricicoccus sp.]|nr:DNA repair protein RadA [Butyricicoccus pullicaecorum]MDY5972242.1 DNA repair protein RadA [Butyricicoccus sp.]